MESMALNGISALSLSRPGLSEPGVTENGWGQLGCHLHTPDDFDSSLVALISETFGHTGPKVPSYIAPIPLN